MKITNRQIADAIEAVAPLSLQEDWDNAGYQVGDPEAQCTGVLLCVDFTEAIAREAAEKGCNLVISHHPLIFRGVKSIIGRNRVERCIALAFKLGLTVYSSHTPLDNSPEGISMEMGRMLGLRQLKVLAPRCKSDNAGLGAIGTLDEPVTQEEWINRIKDTFETPVVRCSRPDATRLISTVALCGGAGTEFLTDAIQAGAQTFLSSDSKLNQFIDYAQDIFLTDIGHFEAEKCAKQIFYRILCEKFRNFAIHNSHIETNPIYYL